MTPGLAQANRKSWETLRNWLWERSQQTGLEWWWRTTLQVVDAARAEGWDEHFRAGQSMQHLIFSTAAEHGLELLPVQPPRVTLAFDQGRMFVAWSRSNLWFSEAERRTFVTEKDALAVLKQYLSDLWTETQGNEEMPRVLV